MLVEGETQFIGWIKAVDFKPDVAAAAQRTGPVTAGTTMNNTDFIAVNKIRSVRKINTGMKTDSVMNRSTLEAVDITPP